MKLTVRERLELKILRRESGCWEWSGARFRLTGYGAIKIDGRTELVHRVAYELFVGPIPDGLHIDHLCRNRPCVNPDHLEAVTQQVNNERTAKAKCSRGHEFTLENTYVRPSGSRQCRKCRQVNALKSNQRRKAKGQVVGDACGC